MTRKEQIKQAAREYATHLTDMGEMDYHGHFEKEIKFNDNEYRMFIAGAEWADNNPKPLKRIIGDETIYHYDAWTAPGAFYWIPKSLMDEI